jgi:hypothetical protein
MRPRRRGPRPGAASRDCIADTIPLVARRPTSPGVGRLVPGLIPVRRGSARHGQPAALSCVTRPPFFGLHTMNPPPAATRQSGSNLACQHRPPMTSAVAATLSASLREGPRTPTNAAVALFAARSDPQRRAQDDPACYAICGGCAHRWRSLTRVLWTPAARSELCSLCGAPHSRVNSTMPLCRRVAWPSANLLTESSPSGPPCWRAGLAGGKGGIRLARASGARVPLGGVGGVPIDDRARRRVQGHAVGRHGGGQGACGSPHAPASDS